MSSRAMPAVLGTVLLLLGSTLLPSRAAAAPRALLPDLDQEAPSGLTVSSWRAGGKTHFSLGFGAGVRNVGDGPLIIAGHRASRHTARMVADQLIERTGASPERVRGIGHMRYVVSPDHRHWHYLGFDRYVLRQVGGTHRQRDRKTGFCLGDRYAVPPPALPSASPAPLFTSRCGLGRPDLTAVREGISVGYGDYYAANLEGQYVSLDGMPDGRYTLVHRVNADHRLRELRYDNDAASVLLSLHWESGVPYLRVLASCPDSARCTAASAARAAGHPGPPSARVAWVGREGAARRRLFECCCC
jgi:Lysyl oxidase